MGWILIDIYAHLQKDEYHYHANYSIENIKYLNHSHAENNN